jgi:sulfide:quinone oxidoreductase
VFAAGDCADHAIKQGGLAAQQAGAAAAAIVADASGGPEPYAWDPVLRAMLIAPPSSYFLRRRLDGLDPGRASSRALWWPPAKIAGRELAGYLAGLDDEAGRPVGLPVSIDAGTGGVEVLGLR